MKEVLSMEEAIESNNPELFTFLIDNAGVPPNLQEVFCQVLLSPNPDFLEILSNRIPIDMNTNFLIEFFGYISPLQLVINDIKKVKILMQHGANVNYFAYSCSPIHLALENGNIGVARFLLENGANTNNINLASLLLSSNFFNNAKKNLDLIPFLQSLYVLDIKASKQIDQWMRDNHLVVLQLPDKVSSWHKYMGFNSEEEEIRYNELLLYGKDIKLLKSNNITNNKSYEESYISNYILFNFDKDDYLS